MTHAAAQPKNPRFHSGTMSNVPFDLATNLAILATLLVACHLRNLARPDLDLNGGYAYLMLASTALVFDAALAFLVFACARRRYGKSSTPGAFVGACERLRTGQRALLRRPHAHPQGEGQGRRRARHPDIGVHRVPSADVTTHEPHRHQTARAPQVLITPDQPGR